jgi:hypothetical protein
MLPHWHIRNQIQFVLQSSASSISRSQWVRCLRQPKHWSRFLIPLLQSGSARRLFPNVRPFRVPCTTLSLVHFFRRLCSTDGPLWQRPLRRHAPARRVIPPQVAANFFRDPPLPWVGFFSCRLRPTARCLSPCRFFSAPKFPLRPLP